MASRLRHRSVDGAEAPPQVHLRLVVAVPLRGERAKIYRPDVENGAWDTLCAQKARMGAASAEARL